ncbi:nucleoside deaminase [Candidatus Gracilibacteria bacterium]|nr:nucleoside deaminase [Candidatus Gracilibacteria bacterium]
MENHKKFIQRAIEISRQKMNEGAGGPFGCVIVKDNAIIAEGWNQVTSTNDPSAHAEVSAIREACKKLNSFQLTGCTIYTSCYPCPMCLGAIYWARPESVYFANTAQDAAKIGFDDAFIYEELQKPFEKFSIPFHQVVAFHKDGLKVFKEWEQKEDKMRY